MPECKLVVNLYSLLHMIGIPHFCMRTMCAAEVSASEVVVQHVRKHPMLF